MTILIFNQKVTKATLQKKKGLTQREENDTKFYVTICYSLKKILLIMLFKLYINFSNSVILFWFCSHWQTKRLNVKEL